MTSATKKEYEKLLQHSRYIHTLLGIESLLHWDQETFMPDEGAEFRGDELKTLSGIVHKEKVSRKFSNPLAQLIDIKTGEVIAHDLSEPEKRALKEWRRDYLIETALPKKFVENFSKLCSQSILAWRKARANKNFKEFLPFLKKVITANRKKADYIGYEGHPYNALLDLYEPGMTVDKVGSIFDKLKTANVDLLKKILASPQIDKNILHGNYPEAKQLELAKKLLDTLGYDKKRGRLDLSTHPFSSSSHPKDSRITTRIHTDYVFSCVSTVLHEAGHAFYAMGLPEEHFGSPLGEAISMGIHESQSRFWETRIGLSKPFWQYFLPIVRATFPDMLANVDVETCYKAVNQVQPSFIRVEADEVTYPLHVILRFELEKALIDGSLKPEDVPEAWNAKMQSYLQITPPNDAEGCLQDIHWSMGAFGYFPTYALGNLYAAQLFTLFAKRHPDWETRIANGEFIFIKDFLHETVHRHGKCYRGQELLEKITGKPFTADDYITYLNTKYSGIYPIRCGNMECEAKISV